MISSDGGPFTFENQELATSSPGLFPQKLGEPFFEGKALGTRLRSWGPLNRCFFLHGFLTQIFPVGGCHSASPGHTSSETLISPRTCLSLKSVLA